MLCYSTPVQLNAYIHTCDVRITAEIQAYTYLPSMMYFSAVQSVVLAGRTFICLYKFSPEYTHGLMDYLMSALTHVCYFPFHVVCIFFMIICSRQEVPQEFLSRTYSDIMYIHLYIYNLSSLMIFWGCLILVIAVQIGLMCSLSLYGESQKGKQSLDTITLLAARVQD
jgi:hypothetical protein